MRVGRHVVVCKPAAVTVHAANTHDRVAAGRITLGRVSTTEAIVRELRGKILDGSLPAGTHLREVELSVRLGVSRQSLRSALAELTFYGLLRREPHRGVRVPQLTRRDVHDIYDLRRIIEGEAVARVALDPSGIAPVEAAVAALERLPEDVAWSQVAEADVAIHRALVEASGSARLVRAADLFTAEMLLVVVPAQHYMRPSEMAAEHRELLDVIRAGNPRAARDRFARHLELGTDELLAFIPDD
jgi:DNA-binding GntR family transcriptional regulator